MAKLWASCHCKIMTICKNRRLAGVIRFTFAISACGDGSQESASVHGTTGTPSSTTGDSLPPTATGQPTTSEGTVSATGGELTGTASDTSTGEPTGSTGASTESSTGTSSASMGTSSTSMDTSGTSTSSTETTASTGADTTTGGLDLCGDMPPLGYVGDFDVDCKSEPQIGVFKPVVEWKKSVWAVDPDANRVIMAPLVVSLDDDNDDGEVNADDTPDIVYVTYNINTQGPATVRAMSGDGSKELWSSVDAACGATGLAAGDIDGDGLVEIVGVTADLRIRAFEHNGAIKWTTALTYENDMAFCYSAPAIADMDGNGDPEVIVGRVILNSDGTERGKGMFGTGAPQFASASFAADIDGDGEQEVVVGNALYTIDGGAIWSNGQPDGYPAVADFDADGKPEIVVSSIDTVRLQGGGGGVLWSVNNPAGAGGPPTIADFDGDGAPEIGIAGKIGYVVFDTDGAVLWQQPTQDASSAITGSTVYDFEGDGVADVVYADEITLYVYSGKNGAIKLQYTDHANATLIEYPLVADVDGDGHAEIVVVHSGYYGPELGITVLGDMDESWRPGRKIWNQHAYSITNVEDNGAIPKVPAPNWVSHNNFRSGDLSPPDGLAAPNLAVVAPDGCLNECIGGAQATVWFQIGNKGAAPLTAGAMVEVYGIVEGLESLLTVQVFNDQLLPGEFSDGESVLVDIAGLESLRLVVKPGEEECLVDPADELVLMPPFCSNP